MAVDISSSWTSALAGALLLAAIAFDRLISIRVAPGPQHQEETPWLSPARLPTTPRRSSSRSSLRALVRWETLLVLLLVGTLLYGDLRLARVLDVEDVFYIGLNVGEVAIMALPLALIVITGEIDLSIAAILGLTGVVMAELFMHGWPIWLAMAAALAVGAVCGAFNGFLVTRPRPALARGHDRHADALPRIAQVILPTDTIAGLQAAVLEHRRRPDPRHAAPWSILFFAVLAVVVGVVLHATPLGRSIFAIGAGRRRRSSPASG